MTHVTRQIKVILIRMAAPLSEEAARRGTGGPTDSGSIFTILGHGEEELIDIEERNELPPGYTLVTFTECGNVSYHESTINKVITAFLNPANRDILEAKSTASLSGLFQSTLNDNVKSHFTKLGILDETIHVYHSGDKYPKLTCKMFLDWRHPTDYSKHVVAKAGLYKFPLIGDKASYTEKKPIDIVSGSFYSSFTNTGDSEVKNLYSNAIIPSQEELSGILSERSGRYLSEFSKRLSYPLEKIFEAGGPGVYYWVICRALASSVTLENYVDVINDKYPSVAERYKPYIYRWIDRYDEVAPLMNQNAVNPEIKDTKKTKLQKIRNELNLVMSKIRRVRSKSINVQTFKKGGSRNQKKIRSRRKTQKRRLFL